MLAELMGPRRTPIGAYARFDADGRLNLPAWWHARRVVPAEPHCHRPSQ